MEYEIKNDKLVITVNVGAKAVKDAKPSASGKSRVVATTSGLVPVGNGMKFALNVIVK